VRADGTYLIPLFQNLASNAIKYRNNEPPRIHIGAREVDGELRFSVSDNGIGIDPEYHQQIFEVFQRLHGREVPGTGLGLAICKRVVERYRGRIWVESQPGSGSTFYFTMPEVKVWPTDDPPIDLAAHS
jgi:signal transduction histidine kinase